MGKFITPKRLETFWATAVNKLTEGINGKKLSSNDFTDELKEKYDKAESNKIDSISVNGEKQTIDTDKNVNIEFDAGTGIQDITQEEYDALSEEEKMGDTIYHITDAEDDNVVVNVMLGETSETAYAGDKGKALADKIGDIDISDIGDGTVSDAIRAVNTKIGSTDISSIGKGTLTDILSSLTYPNAGAHNSIYRGKNLGTSYTAEQKAQIQAGTFNDLYIGDYWVIDGVTWRIAHFDYWLNTGDTQCTTHHAVIVPDTCLYSTTMNDTDTTTGAYVGSKMYTENLETAKTTINNVFGSDNILNHREYLANTTNAISDPVYESDGSWCDSTVELMNECMVYGSNIYHNVKVNGEMPKNHTVDKSQLALFRLDSSRICNRTIWWMRDVVSMSEFANISTNGVVAYGGGGAYFGVRPVFGIC